jgi:hypothetical protein
MCIPAFLYPQARVSEEPSAMPIPDNAKGFPVIEDAYLKQARLQLMIGMMNQSMGNQGNSYGQRPRRTTYRVGTNDPNAQPSAQQQQPDLSGQPVQNPGSGNFGP